MVCHQLYVPSALTSCDEMSDPNAVQDVARFVRDARSLEVWSNEFFLQIIERIETM